MIDELNLTLPDGRTLHVYDTGPRAAFPVIWHHGTPNIGSPPEPLFTAAARLGLRLIGYDRPGYGGSSPRRNRSVASAAADVAALADTLELHHIAVLGHSGGGPHALSCAALLPERVVAAISVAGLAPYGAADLDWYAGMHSPAALEAAAARRATKEAFEATEPPFDPEVFTPADHAALNGPWSWLNSVVGPALQAGPAPLIDDDLAYVCPWGFDPHGIRVPTLLLHGQLDRMVPATHSEWLAHVIPNSDLRLMPGDGHISVLNHAEAALEWLRSQLNHPTGDRP
ncbi:alpha/beta hydrolase [Deinococcus sp. KSM4-11]|uniref:alpha/beta fold hydrolase n=1 Tax=Deinococcus sp. KSM4-11 TaxID=2568654 RepID=UPI0010A58A1F|nr:alpha/beta fold hydrolase [Deinococcus sp. KSM4-11]THF83579.1 alpha/beta hydrolase [Deinococcus sp. KSM4-11]